MKKSIIFLISLSSLLLSCDNSGFPPINEKSQVNESIVINEHILSPKTKLSFLFDSIHPTIQKFTINGNIDTVITGIKGTSITIQSNTFINSQGHSPTEINLSLLEATNFADILTSNLQTTSNGKILQTGGMIYLKAEEGKSLLTIAKNKKLYIEINSKFEGSNMSVFKGDFDSKNEINWTQSGSIIKSNLISIPFKYLNFRRGLECLLSDEQIKTICQPKFEETYIATQEFSYRAKILNNTSCEHYNGLNNKLLNIYTQNIDKPLYIADSLAAEYIYVNFKSSLDTSREFKFDRIGWMSHFYKAFLWYKNQRLTNPINISQLGINENTTIEELISNGYTKTKAEQLIDYYMLRKQKIQSLKDKKQTSSLASYFFSSNNLGWINVDQLINETGLEPSNFKVKVTSNDSIKDISLSLVIPNYNSSIFPIHKQENVFSFTKNKANMRNLPINESAYLVAFAHHNNQPYFAQKMIKIPKNGEIELNLIATTKEKIKRRLNWIFE